MLLSFVNAIVTNTQTKEPTKGKELLRSSVPSPKLYNRYQQVQIKKAHSYAILDFSFRGHT